MECVKARCVMVAISPSPPVILKSVGFENWTILTSR